MNMGLLSRAQELQQLLDHPYAILYEPLLLASMNGNSPSLLDQSSQTVPDTICSVSSIAEPPTGTCRETFSVLPLSRTPSIPTSTPSRSVIETQREPIMIGTLTQTQTISNVSRLAPEIVSSTPTIEKPSKKWERIKNASGSFSSSEAKIKSAKLSNPKIKAVAPITVLCTPKSDDSKFAVVGANVVADSGSQVELQPHTEDDKSVPCKVGFDAEWEQMFQQLVKYKTVHKQAIPPRECMENPKLGRWVAFQLRRYREKSLLVERQQKLDSLGLVWDRKPRQTARWMKMYKSLVEYKRDYHDTRVPQSQGKLGRWVHAQRVAFKNKTLSSDRIAYLDAINFIWDGHDKRYEYEAIMDHNQSSQQPNLSLPWRPSGTLLW
mmetsp:Transcript_29108/g.68445  ORF Transcript_29108/g.68445 Transcript_29108/m.68445 type:complete len:379 (-) Transcript_29108:382-1518(-)